MLQTLIPSLLALGVLFLTGVVAMGLMRLVAERLWPAGPARPGRDGWNLAVFAAGVLGQTLLTPVAGVVTTAVVNRAGGGLIVLPSHGPGLIAGVIAYLLAMDLGEYVFHRAQHAIPVLWEMHSLHHSDPDFDSTTTVRHFWADPLLRALSVWLVVALLFKVDVRILAAYGTLTLYNYAIHANTRLDFGRLSWLLNGPAYHRLHHSCAPEHFDKNFAALLPIYDVVFGTYRRPRPGERIVTGLDTGDRPRTLLDVAAWPVRRLWRKPAAGALPAAGFTVR